MQYFIIISFHLFIFAWFVMLLPSRQGLSFYNIYCLLNVCAFGRLTEPVPFGSVLMFFFCQSVSQSISILKCRIPRYLARFTNEVQVSPTCNGEAMIQVPRKELGTFRNEPCFVFGFFGFRISLFLAACLIRSDVALHSLTGHEAGETVRHAGWRPTQLQTDTHRHSNMISYDYFCDSHNITYYHIQIHFRFNTIDQSMSSLVICRDHDHVMTDRLVQGHPLPKARLRALEQSLQEGKEAQ